MPTMQYWTLEPPTKWQAGRDGHKPDAKVFYFDCADCGAKEPPIAGIISTDGTYSGIGLLGSKPCVDMRPAMFCEPCFEARKSPKKPSL